MIRSTPFLTPINSLIHSAPPYSLTSNGATAEDIFAAFADDFLAPRRRQVSCGSFTSICSQMEMTSSAIEEKSNHIHSSAAERVGKFVSKNSLPGCVSSGKHRQEDQLGRSK